MIDDRDLDALLHDALRKHGLPAPFPVDVADRVMARIAVLGPAPRREPAPAHLRLWAAAAAIFGIALTGALLYAGPSLGGLAANLVHVLATSTSTALKLAAPAGALAGSLSRVAGAMLSSAQTILRPLAPFQPLAQALLVLLTAGMLGVTTFIVGRDMRARATQQEPS